MKKPRAGSTKATGRDYKREYATFQGKPEQIARRSQRNKARRKLAATGAVKKGDGKDVDHISRSRSGALNNSRKNLRVLPKSKNRSRK